MDWLRSCYSSQWNLPGAGIVPGRYFWSDPAAPAYPDWSYLGSRNWHAGDGSAWPEFGETEEATQTWNNGELGQLLPNAVNVGDGSCIGSTIVGPVLSEPTGLTRGVDRRCYSIPMPPETHSCTLFNPSPLRWNITLSTIVNAGCTDCAVLNRTYTLEWVSGCNWVSETMEWCTGPTGPQKKRWSLLIGSTFVICQFTRNLGALPTNLAIYRGLTANWSAFGPNTLSVLSFDNTFCDGWPASITLTPAL